MLGRSKAQERQKTPPPTESHTQLLEQMGELIHSLRTSIATHSRDWSVEKRDAWVYGVVCGWAGDPDLDARSEIVALHNYDAATMERMSRLHGYAQRAETAFLEKKRRHAQAMEAESQVATKAVSGESLGDSQPETTA